MYKKIRASSDLVAVPVKSSKVIEEVFDEKKLDCYKKALEAFGVDLKKERLNFFKRLDISIVWDCEKHHTIALPSGTCKLGCFYVLKDDTVVYVSRIDSDSSSIDLIHLSRMGELEHG